MNENIDEDTVYQNLNPGQRLLIDDMKKSTKRWSMVKWYVLGGSAFLLGLLALLS